MWTWIGLYLGAAFGQAGLGGAPRLASAATAAVIAAGGIGCIAAGRLADRIGRTATTMLAMVGSGACAALNRPCLRPARLLVLVALVWGATIVVRLRHSSRRPSASWRLPDYVGTALSLQTCLGFLLTLASIRLYPVIVAAWGWPWSFLFLAPGPFLGTLAMCEASPPAGEHQARPGQADSLAPTCPTSTGRSRTRRCPAGPGTSPTHLRRW